MNSDCAFRSLGVVSSRNASPQGDSGPHKIPTGVGLMKWSFRAEKLPASPQSPLFPMVALHARASGA